MNQRDELAGLIDLVTNRFNNEVTDPWLWSLTDAIHSDGYRKARTITTQEEANNLPVGAIVLDAYAATCTRLKEGLSPYDWMRVTTSVKGNSHHRFPYLPAEVLYVPEETQR